MKKLFSLLLSAALLSGLLVTGASAATLQSNQAVYQLSQDPLGTVFYASAATETHSATLVPVGTAIQRGGDGLLPQRLERNAGYLAFFPRREKQCQPYPSGQWDLCV